LLPELSSVDSFELPKDVSVQGMFESVTEQLMGRELSAEERDRILEPPGSDAPARQRALERPELKSVGLEWLATLRAYSIALKNLEEIDAPNKSEHLHIILNAWSRAVGYSLMLSRTAFEMEIEIEGTKLNIEKMFGDLKPLVLRTLLISVPAIVSGLLRSDLGTQKLSLMFREIDPAGRDSVTVRF
jgi:hypothetical protein